MEANSVFRWQPEVLAEMRAGRDALVLQPTGSGKSICAEVPALEWGQRVLVVSPLRGLMADQCRKWTEKGLSIWNAASDGRATQNEDLDKLLHKQWQILLVAPERLEHWIESGLIWQLFRGEAAVDWVILDEFHLFRDWSSFRPSYLCVKAFLSQERRKGGFRMVALSATMAVKEACAWFRELSSDFFISLGALGRTNIFLQVLPLWRPEERWLVVAELLKTREETTLLFTRTRESCEHLRLVLRAMGIPVEAYHGGNSPHHRHTMEEALRFGRLRNLVCTSAFGMGIDLDRIERVIHFELPYNLASYWQEVGRCGRNGSLSRAVLLWSPSDRRLSHCDSNIESTALEHFLSSPQCRRKSISDHLGLLQESHCGACDRCRDFQGMRSPPQDPRYSPLWSHRQPWWLYKYEKNEISI